MTDDGIPLSYPNDTDIYYFSSRTATALVFRDWDVNYIFRAINSGSQGVTGYACGI